MNHFNFLTSWRENDAPSTPSLLWHWACVVEQAPPPRSPNPPEMNTTAQTQAPGSRPEPRRIREVSRMKYDLNVPTEMENIPSSVSLCPKDTGVITHQLWCIWVNFHLYHRGPCRHSEVRSGVAHTGFCFATWPWVRDRRRRSGLPAETPQLEVKLTWVTDVVKEISMMGITSCILYNVISPISAAWGDLHSQRIIGTPLVIRGWAQRRHNWLLKRFKSQSLQHTDQLQNKRQYSSRRSRGAWSQRTELTWLTYIQLKSQLPSRLSDASCPQKYGQIWLHHLLTAAFKSWFPQHTECHSTTCARIQQLKKGQAAATIYTVSITISIGTIWPPPLSVFPTPSPSSSSLHPANSLMHFFRCIW